MICKKLKVFVTCIYCKFLGKHGENPLIFVLSYNVRTIHIVRSGLQKDFSAKEMLLVLFMCLSY